LRERGKSGEEQQAQSRIHSHRSFEGIEVFYPALVAECARTGQRADYRTVNVAGGLEAPPTVTTSG
jgi:hypothetical protein